MIIIKETVVRRNARSKNVVVSLSKTSYIQFDKESNKIFFLDSFDKFYSIDADQLYKKYGSQISSGEYVAIIEAISGDEKLSMNIPFTI